MAQLYFYYSAMNAGKSTSLLQSAYNYRERGMVPLVLTAGLDDRYGVGKITSRIGLESEALIYRSEDNLIELIKTEVAKGAVHCILVDESQFLTKLQVQQLTHVVDNLDIPVLCYGLRTDFQGELFEGAQYLLAWADKLVELKTICHCGRKANMVVRMDAEGNPVRDGDQVQIGGNDSYVSMCRTHFRELVWD
ncbi:thymidine kinase [Ferrimonas balearica DSM 9799]|uniref:Thymidine kinase n=1 Tax=Ferrimonas balearica (strain DSM 9799 / CCM 4581 / KCTC 23876 / PAT) TaxID=550540 RepID=E1SU45_FERBD|nr:thymidine kinase [Ferrimonas balearica]ADN75192.1 thymidine kinase [Ferrimonas balearica DSM 9799]MBW3138088.1 thymidine kinase [Ferrimonas balearica]MBW3164345.1 thymidine kinase [Ferrimonas balearica]MBY5978855.1 thymidine kinase [Ferrimonas balearica]MBY6105166.1 thymidine kinase [Ferrimonas balearica]